MIRRFLFSTLAVIAIVMSSDAQKGKSRDTSIPLKAPAGKAIAAFAEGCFWCSEHIFEALVGVDSATSGYAGGTAINPSYELVNTETTGHAESVLVYYDPKVISYGDLLKAFFTSHDPTTVDRQGPDQGNSYRSIIFYSTPAEKQLAEQAKKVLLPPSRIQLYPKLSHSMPSTGRKDTTRISLTSIPTTPTCKAYPCHDSISSRGPVS
jgi:peptide-methionine (S)-S-oxide reductase